MDSQLNPNAAEFVPVSSPKRSIKINVMSDSFVAGSPMRTTVMDDIMVPSQQEFDEEISARPHEIDEKDASSNGNHEAQSDYDFYTEQQKIMNPSSTTATTVAATAGLDESEISSTKAEYGDETINFSCTTSTDLHKSDISSFTMEDSFGDSDCDIYNRNNPMTISYTPCDFKAAFNKEVDLNAVHDLSDDGDLENENCCSSEIQTLQSQKATDLGRHIDFDILSNGGSSNAMETSITCQRMISKDDEAFLKFQDTVEPKNTEFSQVELKRHTSSSPIDPSFEHDFSKVEDKSFNLLENKEEMMMSVEREVQEEEEKAEDKEIEQAESHKEAEYVDDEKDIATYDDIVPSKDNNELIVINKPVEIATNIIQSDVFKDSTISQEQCFLSSTIDESSKLNPLSMAPIETELMEVSQEPLKNGLISSMENLKLTTEEEERPIMVFNLSSEVSEFQQSEKSSINPFYSEEQQPALSDVASKQSLLEDSLMQQPDSMDNCHKESSSSFLPTLVSETAVSDNDRPIENLLKLNETTSTTTTIQVPTIDDNIEENKTDEFPKSCSFENITEKPSQNMDESVCFINTDDKQIYMNWESSPDDGKSVDIMKVDDTNSLNLPELVEDSSKDLITQQPDLTDNRHKESSSSFLPTFASETVIFDNDRPNENSSKLNEITTEVPILDNIEVNKADEYPQSFSFDDITERKSTEKMEVHVNEFEKVIDDNNTVALNLSESIQEFTGLEKQLEPENFTPEESPMAELKPSIEDDNIVEHKESIGQEAVEDNLLLDTKEEEEEKALEAKEDVDIIQVTKITESVGTTESTELSKPSELTTPIEDIVIEKASDAFDLVKSIESTEISMPKDTEKTVVSTEIIESKEESAKNVEITKSVEDTTTTMGMIETAEIAAEPENITKTVDATEAVPVTMIQDVEEKKVVEPLKVEEEKATPVTVEPLAVGALAATGVAAVAAGTVTAATTSNASSNKTKAKPTVATRSMKSGSSSTKAAPPKSTPTSPSKTITSTTKSTGSTTATATTKRPAGSVAARPKHLDTTSSKSLTATNVGKSTSTTKMASKTSSTTAASSTTKTAAMRPSSAQTKSKPTLSASTRSTAGSMDKKSAALNSDAKPSTKTTTVKASTKLTSTSSGSAKTSASRTTTGSRTSTTALTPSTTTTLSATGKSRPTSATTAAKSPAKSVGTTNAISGGLSNATKSKTTSTSNNLTKTSRTSLAKSPMIDKQIKETANKQISMSRTTSSPITKTTRSSMSATTTLNSNATKRVSNQKSTTSTTTTSAHSPIKKITSRVGQSSGATKSPSSSSTTKVMKVMQNGTADNAEITKTATTTTTTTIITTDSKNEDDVPKKDLSPVVAHTDNQLISSAD